MRLTKQIIDRAEYEGEGNQRCVLWDDSLPGFGLRVYPSGKKAFLISYRTNGRKRLMTIGAYGTMTLQEAHKRARQAFVAAEDGADPLGERQRIAQGETMWELCGTYIKRYARPRKRSWRDDAQRIEAYILPAWGGLKAANVTRADVSRLHGQIGRRSIYAANRTLSLLGKMFALAEEWGVVPEGHRNPARGIDKFREEKRDRWVTHEELPRLAEAIDREDLIPRSALWLYLLTGARKSELLRSKWEEIDPARKELRIPETKSGTIHYVPLSEASLMILAQIPQVEGNPYILPGRKAGGHLVNIDKPWRRVRHAAGVDDVRLHDLRRTVGSWLAQSGNSLHLVGRVLNHSNPSTTAVYARFGQDQVREALEQHGQQIMGIAGKADTAEVVKLDKSLRKS